MYARKILVVLCIVSIVAGVTLVAGCGSKEPVDIAGNEYMCEDQEFDNRMVMFNPDGSFDYRIVAVNGGGTITGTYEVEGDKATLVFI